MERLVAVLGVPVVVQRTPEWYAKRLGRVTSSEAASVLGESPYESATDVLFRKFGLGRPFTGNAATRYGQLHEPVAIQAYCAALGRVSFEVGLIDYEAVHGPCPELAFVAGSPDGITVRRRGAPRPEAGGTLLGPEGPERRPAPTREALAEALGEGADEEPVMLEVKCPLRRRIVPGVVPRHYYAQVQLNMFICGLRRADFVEYRPAPFELSVVRVEPDEAWLARALPRLRAFHAECAKYAGRIEEHPEYAKYAPASPRAPPAYAFLDGPEAATEDAPTFPSP
jgi:putative phage-type endonuclease